MPYCFTWTDPKDLIWCIEKLFLYPIRAAISFGDELKRRDHSQMGRQIRPSDLSGYFDGQIAHKNMLMGVMDEWSQKQSSPDFCKFRTSSSSPVMGFDQPALPDVVRKYNKKIMWVHHSVFAPEAISGRLKYGLHEYGHDFNANGSFGEFGHNKLLLPVLHGGVISALVYIEYSPDKRDGVPMISVGRFFKSND